MIIKAFVNSLTTISAALLSSAHSGETCEMGAVVLLQPEYVFSQRLSAPDSLARYIQAINEVAIKIAANHPMHSPNSGFVVVAVKPGNKSKVWLDLDQNLEKHLSNEFFAEIQKIPPPQVNGGVISFGLNFKLWGSKRFSKDFPNPKEWRNLVEKSKKPMETSDIINALWK